MERFTYTWRDFALCFRIALNFRRMLAGAKIIILTLLAYWLCGAVASVPTGMPRPAFGPIEGSSVWLYLAGIGLLWWWAVSKLFIAIGRSAAIEFAAGNSISLRSMRVYGMAYGKYHTRSPFAVVAFAAPFALLVLGWAWVASLGSVGAVVAAITSPIALVLGVIAALILILGVVSLPLQAGSTAVHGGDTYEGISRAIMYATMAPQRFVCWYVLKLVMWAIAGALALAVAAAGVAVVVAFVGLLHGQGAAYELVDMVLGLRPLESGVIVDAALARGVVWSSWALAAIAGGYFMAFDATSDVLVFLLMRYRCDTVPVTEFFDPARVVREKVSRMERREAEEALGKIASTDAAPVVIPK